MSEDRKRLRVASGKEEKIREKTPEEGKIYFTTDTKKILLGKNEKFLTMGNNLDIFYGKKEIPKDNSGNEPDPNVTFYFEEIENIETNIPEVNDLILNVDGCFYKILRTSENGFYTERLTLQGTGSGGGGGGGSVVSSFSIMAPNGATAYFASESTTAEIYVKGFSTDDTNYISRVTCAFSATPEKPFFIRDGLEHPLGTNFAIDLLPWLQSFSEYGSALEVTVQDKYGTIRSLPFTVTLVKLNLAKVEKELIKIENNELEYTAILSGGNNLENKKIAYTLYHENTNDVALEITNDVTVLNGSVYAKLNLSEVPHGAYDL